MSNTAIIIPTRLGAKRFPNKPLAKINNIPMIVHVFNRAKEAKLGEVFVATPDEEIADVVKKNGGQALITKNDHPTGTDRIYEVYQKNLKNKVDLIINLQGDMPNIEPHCITRLEKFMRKENTEIGTLASNINNNNEFVDVNIVKVLVDKELKNESFLNVKDFFRSNEDLTNKKVYHHIGIYAFTNDALTKYVNLSRSKLEIERNLEQMRALENDMSIKVALNLSTILGVDTEKDLEKIKREMN